jgi:hypothetical protein
VSGVPNVTNKKHNTEILSTLGTPDTGQRQTNKNTKQRKWTPLGHQTTDKDKQKKNIVFLFVCLCPVSGVPNVDSISVLCFLFVTLGTPDTGQRQTNKNTTQRYCQHWVHQTQDKDKQTKKHNTEILSTLGTPDS